MRPAPSRKPMNANAESDNQKVRASGSKWQYTKRGYALSQSVKQLNRYKMASFVTLIVLGITLALPVILLFASTALQQLGTRSLEGESLTAYLNIDISDLQGAALAQAWKEKPSIRSTRYISKDEALQLFRQNSDIGDAISVLGSNPLPGAVMVFPDSNTLSSARLDTLVSQLRQLDSVARIQLDLRWVKRLKSVVSLIQLVGGLLAGFLTLTALLVIGNTIRLELLRRRSEMEVANLLGATNSFMNRPILYTGALYGFLGGAVACLVAVLAFSAIQEPAHELSSLYESSFRLLMPNFSQILIVLGVSVLLGILGAFGSLYRPSQQLTYRIANT
ncbi:MAG: cell division transport system permease protein [bacterium]|jgi:cell division transport system permease protein